jgi:hypothetical protein
VLGWAKIYKLAHAFVWEYSYKRLKFAQLLGQLGIFLTCGAPIAASSVTMIATGAPKNLAMI